MAFQFLPFIAASAEFAAEAAVTTAAATQAGTATAAEIAAASTAATSASLAAIGTTASAGGTAAQGVSAHKAAQAQQAAAEVSRDKAKISAGRERRRIVREAQAQRAGVVSQAVSQGVEAGSTARIGAVQDIGAQESRNLGFVAQQADLGKQGGAFLDKAATYTQRANLFKVGAGISNQFLQEIERG
jgi:hypothetical protein